MRQSALNVFRLSRNLLLSCLVLVAALAALGGVNLYTYQRFTNEVGVAVLSFEQAAERSFLVTIEADGNPRRFLLKGDEWQLDARMIKWTDWLTFMGEDPLFRLDRISGRYVEVDRARSHPPSVHSLRDGAGLDLWSFARRAGDWLPGIDAAYGSSVFLPMRDGAVYEVSMSRTGLLARERQRGASGSR